MRNPDAVPPEAEGVICHDAEDREYKWGISPHPYSADYDFYVTDDDQAAFTALRQIAENIFDDMNPGDECTIKIKMNKP